MCGDFLVGGVVAPQKAETKEAGGPSFDQSWDLCAFGSPTPILKARSQSIRTLFALTCPVNLAFDLIRLKDTHPPRNVECQVGCAYITFLGCMYDFDQDQHW